MYHYRNDFDSRISGNLGKSLKGGWKMEHKLWKDDRGIGVVEIILILVILIGLVIIFKSQIETIIGSAFDAITRNTDKIIG